MALQCLCFGIILVSSAVNIGKSQELIKESGNKQLQARSDKDENTPGHSVDNDRLKSSSNNSVSDTDKDHKASRLPVILPAVLTVIIFIVCVILIAFKSYNADEFLYQGSVPDLTESEDLAKCWPTRKKRKRGTNELYDVMLKQYKAESHRKNPLRKSSTYQIEGVAGNDPQSIAKKHLLLNRMRDPGNGSSAVGTLIKLSSTAFIASSMVRNGKDKEQKAESVPEEDSAPLLHNEEKEECRIENQNKEHKINGNVPEPQSSFSQDSEDKPDLPKIELALSGKQTIELDDDGNIEELEPRKESLSPESIYPPNISNKFRNSGSSWFKYKRLEKQPFVDDDSDDELDYDCAQHIHRILSASRENIEEARRILPDDVKDIVLPQDLEAALADFEMWTDSSV